VIVKSKSSSASYVPRKLAVLVAMDELTHPFIAIGSFTEIPALLPEPDVVIISFTLKYVVVIGLPAESLVADVAYPADVAVSALPSKAPLNFCAEIVPVDGFAVIVFPDVETNLVELVFPVVPVVSLSKT